MFANTVILLQKNVEIHSAAWVACAKVSIRKIL